LKKGVYNKQRQIRFPTVIDSEYLSEKLKSPVKQTTNHLKNNPKVKTDKNSQTESVVV